MAEFIDEVKDYIENERRELKTRNLIVTNNRFVEGEYAFYESHGLFIVGETGCADLDIKDIYEKTYYPFLCHVEHLLVDFEFKIFKRFIKNVKKTYSSYNYEIFINTVLSQLTKRQAHYYCENDSPFAEFMVCVQRALMKKISLYRIYNDI